jgi:hypothetical protein
VGGGKQIFLNGKSSYQICRHRPRERKTIKAQFCIEKLDAVLTVFIFEKPPNEMLFHVFFAHHLQEFWFWRKAGSGEAVTHPPHPASAYPHLFCLVNRFLHSL